jgi:hypothetical protein
MKSTTGSVKNLLENKKNSEKSPERLKRDMSAYSNINDVDILVNS